MYSFNGNKTKRKIKIFEEFCNKQQIMNAQIVGKNLFCNRPSDMKIFGLYFDFCIEQAKSQIDTESSSFFLSEADLALSLFCERCAMSEDNVSLIDDKRNKFIETRHVVYDRMRESDEIVAKQTIDNNESLIEKLVNLANDLQKTSNENEFDITIAKVSDAENLLQKESFTFQQKERYDAISKRYSKVVTDKMRELQRQSDKAYNLRAAETFKIVYENFKNDEKKYKKNEDDFRDLISNRLCCFDSTRFFNETTIYYNFVYTYIFNAVNEGLKLKMTEYAINSDKKD